MKWITAARGVRYYEHATRKHGIKRDRFYVIYFRRNGKQVFEKIGWASEKWTLDKVVIELNKLKENYRTGAGPVTLKEKRTIEEASKKKKAAEQARLDAENINFRTFFNETYLPIQKTNKSETVWCKEEQHAVNWLFPVVGHLPMKIISDAHIEQIKRNMQEKGRAPRTIQYCFATFRQTWNQARRAGIVSGDSPTRAVKIPKFDNQRRRYLSVDECTRLLEELKNHSMVTYHMALVSLDTGARFSEVAGLQWQNIDLVRETIDLMDTKSGKNRTVYMTERLKALFEGLPKGKPETLIFPDRNGNRCTHISKSFDEAVARLRLNDGINDDRLKCVFHSLRHTHASRLLEAGADIYRVKELLGHGHVTTTERYSHITADRLRAAVKDMEQDTAKKEAELKAKAEQDKKKAEKKAKGAKIIQFRKNGTSG